MKRDCKSITEAIRTIEGDVHRRSSIINMGGKSYRFATNAHIKGASLLIRLLTENSMELVKLLLGRREAKELKEAEKDDRAD